MYDRTMDDPIAQSALVKIFKDNYVDIPRPDGTFSREFVVNPSLSKMVSRKADKYNTFIDSLAKWEGSEGATKYTRDERIVVAPTLMRIGKELGRDVSEIQSLYDRDLKYDENEAVLESYLGMQSLPAGYDGEKLKNLLLQDDEVSDGELEVAVQDITIATGSETAAREFWTKFLSDATTALSKTGLDTDPGVLGKLKAMQDIGLQNLSRYFPGIGERSDIGAMFDAEANRLAKEIYGVPYDKLESESQMAEVEKEAFDRVNIYEDITQEGTEKQSIQVAAVGPLGLPYHKETTPEEEGFTSKAAYLEDVWRKAQADQLNLGKGFVKDHFGNDREKFFEWWSGPRTMGALPVKIPRITDKRKVESWISGEELKKSGKTKDPISGKVTSKEDLQSRYNDSKLSFAKRGIVLKDSWPYWERVPVKQAFESIRN